MFKLKLKMHLLLNKFICYLRGIRKGRQVYSLDKNDRLVWGVIDGLFNVAVAKGVWGFDVRVRYEKSVCDNEPKNFDTSYFKIEDFGKKVYLTV